MIPQPPRGPKPLNNWSAHLTGWGLAASKKRNSAKHTNWPQKPMGMHSHRIIHMATTSSQTMWPGSATRMCWAVTVQAHQPTGMLAAMSQPICVLSSHSCSTRKASQAQSVPTVPGAMRGRPEPKPSAIMCAGCCSMNFTLGWAMLPAAAVSFALLLIAEDALFSSATALFCSESVMAQ